MVDVYQKGLPLLPISIMSTSNVIKVQWKALGLIHDSFHYIYQV